MWNTTSPVLIIQSELEVFRIIFNMRSITSLVTDYKGKPYKDQLCLLRCLALHNGYKVDNLKQPTDIYYEQWLNFNKSTKRFSGVALEEFPKFEECYKVNLEAYTITEEGYAFSVYKSRGRYESSMYVNLYQNHASYINNFATYAQKFQCQMCQRLFNRSNKLRVHQKTCTKQTTFKYPGGFHQAQLSIFDKLDEFGIHVSQKERTFEWFIVYDFEAMLQKTDQKQTDYLQWTAQHVPISVSICSNVEGYTDAMCFIDPNQERLVEQMIAAMSEISEKVIEMAGKKWEYVLKQLNEKIENSENKEDLKKLYASFQSYISQVPVLGFNSAKYDLNLIKKSIAKKLNLHDEGHAFVVKKNNSYTCIASKSLKFLDISQYLAAGSSYAKFLKAYQIEEEKGFFPYEWFDTPQKLDFPELPPHSAFYSSLKGGNINDQEYELCRTVWRENEMKTFQDFLVYYNNLDVKPFVAAVEKLQTFYFEKGIDVFKTAISVPGVARQLLFKTAKEKNVTFALFDERNADLYQTIKNNITGGVSQIFTRYHSAQKTKIRGQKTCGTILGFDANALYLWAIGQPMPVGEFVRRKAPLFKPEVRDHHMAAYYWMNYLIEKDHLQILHKLNNGKEVRIGNYPVDGFSPASAPHEKATVFQFHGCYFHGHQCELTNNIKNKKWHESKDEKYKKTQEITQFLTNQGYNVIEMWECQFKQYKKQHPDIYDFINKQRPNFYQSHKHSVTENQILQSVVDETLFGMVEVDIEVPDQWPSYFRHESMTPFEYFSEMCPLFCNTEVPYEMIGKHMQTHVQTHKLSTGPRKLLVAGMKGRQMLIATPLLRWYLKHGMVITKIYQVIEFLPERCFDKFEKEVSESRRLGDINAEKAIIADTMKLIGNSAYGSLIMDKTKHRKIEYVEGENKTCLKVNDPRFRTLECLDPVEQIYEVEMAKKVIHLDLPIQLAYFILQISKQKMLEFYYDFLDKYIGRDNFEYIEMDTDSAYLAISSSSLVDAIKPEMKQEYLRGLNGFCIDANIEADTGYHWFPRTCCEKHASYDKRTPGLFKLEYSGDEMVGLCSKTYIVRKSIVKKPTNTMIVANKLLSTVLKRSIKRLKTTLTNQYKFSAKGVNKCRIKSPMSIFREVLKTKNPQTVTNRGFRVKNNSIFSYCQIKRGFSYFYCKRRVLDDGIHTVPLDITLCPIPYIKENQPNNSITEDDSDEEPCDFDVFDALVELL
ncbi:hypothetical protein KUTeg_014945 [Tegillarca granosa]|uniref:C2H2-type domain-containing protein n=2 Tax=Tegillarca granosa TaxID=220873 RepID=A0ABQ9ENN3_TEGGR|nr:hypothetical protein KUTeg_014945 [Tegillarca granosa]